MDIRKFFNKSPAPKPAPSHTHSTTITQSTSNTPQNPSTSSKVSEVVLFDDDDEPKIPPSRSRTKKRVLDSSASESNCSSSSSDSDATDSDVPTKKGTRSRKPVGKKMKIDDSEMLFDAVKEGSKPPLKTSSVTGSTSSFFNNSTHPSKTLETVTISKPPQTTVSSSVSTSSSISNVPVSDSIMKSNLTNADKSTDSKPKTESKPKGPRVDTRPWMQPAGAPPNKGNKSYPVASSETLSWGGGGLKWVAKNGKSKSNTKPLSFVISGVLDSMERSECETFIKRHGGKVVGAVSGATDYLVLGEGGGESKSAKAKAMGTSVIDEDALIEIVCSRANLPFPYTKEVHESLHAPSKSSQSASSNDDAWGLSTPSRTSSSLNTLNSGDTQELNTPDLDSVSFNTPSASSLPDSTPSTTSATAPVKKTSLYKRKTQSTPVATDSIPVASSLGPDNILLVDKYKPNTLNQIIGNNTNIDSIRSYLLNFSANLKNKKFDGGKSSPKKAILLVGPPGTGKTTAAIVCSKSLGFDTLEFNASDARSKNAVESEIGNALNNKSLSMYKTGGSSQKGTVVIMDECDGMSSSDRGGMAELVKCIKNSHAPLICIANDAQASQIKTLKNHCEVLSWRRPTAATIAKRLLPIAKLEGLNVSLVAMEKVVEVSKSDIRQCLNVIEMWKRDPNMREVGFDDALAIESTGSKDLEEGVFEVVPRLFRAPDTKWLSKRMDDFFVDSDLVPLFMYENYVTARPALNDGFASFARAADDISSGDLVHRSIQSEQNYSLMPAYCNLSTILPGANFTGTSGRLNFPSLLGRTSTLNKRKNYIKSLKASFWPHMTVNSRDMATQILWAYRVKWCSSLRDGDQADVVEEMEEMDVGKEEWDAILEFGEKYDSHAISYDVDTKTKTALSRALNKSGAGRGIKAVNKGKSVSLANLSGDTLDGEDDEEEDDEEKEKDGKDVVKPTAVKKITSKATKPKKTK